MDTKKICCITTLPLSIRSFFIPQLKHLSENGFDVTVICSADEHLQKELGEHIKFTPVNIDRGINPLGMFKTLLRLYKIFKNEKFDIVQYSTLNASFCGSLAAYFARIKCRNYHMMGFRYNGYEGFLSYVFKQIEKFVSFMSTDIECVSKSIRRLGIDEGIFSESKSTVVWNGSTGGIDLKRFNFSMRETLRNEIRKKHEISPDEFLFGFVGRITKDKGLNELFSAFLLSETNAKLMIIGIPEGEDTLDQELYQKAKQNPNIIFLENIKEIEKYYAAMDILILPSYREGFGMVIIEAAAMGTPAIISDIPGPTDAVIVNKTAFLSEVKNANSLRKTIEEVYNNRAFLPQMRSDCIDYVKEAFDSEKLKEKILERKLLLLNKHTIK